MTPDFECGMIVGGGEVFLATIIFAVGWWCGLIFGKVNNKVNSII